VRDSVVVLNTDDWFRETSLCQTFNFISRQRTTTSETILFDRKAKQSSVGVSTVIVNFHDIEGQDEIARAHAELRRLGGHPPPLDEVLDRKGAILKP
jgi:hypothetical protein